MSARIALRKITTSSSRISSDRRDPDDRLGLAGRSWESRACAAAPVTPERQAGARRQSAWRPRGASSRRPWRPVVGVLVLAIPTTRSARACSSRRAARRCPEDGVEAGLELADDRLDRRLVRRRQLGAVGAVEDHDRADAGLLREGLLSAGWTRGSTRTSTAGSRPGPGWSSASERSRRPGRTPRPSRARRARGGVWPVDRVPGTRDERSDPSVPRVARVEHARLSVA